MVGVAATSLRAGRKREYSLKIRDIRFEVARRISSSSTITVDASSSDGTGYCFDEIREYRDLHRRCSQSRSKKSTKRTEIVITNERSITRQVCLQWSKYCTSAFVDAIDATSTSTSHSNLRARYLRSKYWHLWRAAIAERRLIGESRPRRPSQDDGYNLAKRLIDAQKTKIRQQADTIQQLRAIRATLEQQKFALETDRLLHEHQLDVEDDAIKRKIKYLRNCGGATGRTASATASSSDRSRPSGTDGEGDRAKYDLWWNFVSRMQLRADERRKHRAEIEERKRLAEEERRERLACERRKREEFEYAQKKRKVMEMRREKRRRDDEKRRREVERQRLAELNSIADRHFRQKLAEISLMAFQKYVQMARIEAEHARQFYEDKIRTRYFVRWKLRWLWESRARNDKADQFYDKILMRIGLDRLIMVRFEYIRRLQVADDFYDLCLLKNYFHLWIRFCRMCNRRLREKEMIASQHNGQRLLRNCYEKWKELPRVNFLEQEKEQRLRQWCNTVRELLPDFRPSYQKC